MNCESRGGQGRALLWVIALGAAGCSSESGPPPDARRAPDVDARWSSDAPPRDTAPTRERGVRDVGAADVAQLQPQQFVGTWRLLDTTCEASPPITFVDYSYTLQLQATKGSAIDATATCALTTADFPIVPVATGYELRYGAAVKLSCSPSPCSLTVTTKVGAEVSKQTYTCPNDFPVQSPKEVILTVQGQTMVTKYDDMACFNRYEKTGS